MIKSIVLIITMVFVRLAILYFNWSEIYAIYSVPATYIQMVIIALLELNILDKYAKNKKFWKVIIILKLVYFVLIYTMLIIKDKMI